MKRSLSGACTEPQDTTADIAAAGLMFHSHSNVVFEYGIENALSRAVEQLTRRRGNTFVNAIGALIADGSVDVEAASETLRYLGGMDHAPTQQARLSLLLRSLEGVMHFEE